jgi:hypothetical protein
MMHNTPAQHDSGRLSSEAVHVLKNHLGIILGFIDLVLEDTPENDPRRRDMLEVKQAAVSAVAMLNPSRSR